MPLVAFNKATDPAVRDDLRINPQAVLYVEASRPDLMGRTTIHLLGQGTVVNAVTESVDTVVSEISASLQGAPALVAAVRHYLAPPPEGGPSLVYIAPANVSYARPNLPESQEFWYVRFVDGSELRIVHPLPPGL
jgi:hypothetical protein